MRRILLVALLLGLAGVPGPAFPEQSVHPVPGDLWGGARPAGSAFSPAQRTALPTRDDLALYLGSPNLCAPVMVQCRVYALKDPGRFSFELQTEPSAYLTRALGN